MGPSWTNEVQAATHEQLQRLNRIQGAAHFTDKKHKKNPVPEPKKYPRPYEIFSKEDRPDRYDSDEDQLNDLAADTFGGRTEGGDSGDGD